MSVAVARYKMVCLLVGFQVRPRPWLSSYLGTDEHFCSSLTLTALAWAMQFGGA